MDSTLSKVGTFIEQQGLMQAEGRYLVALSGGADSVCMLLMLRRLRYNVEAVHCNFHLRGEESDRDEAFVKKLCEDQHTELHLIHFDTAIYAQLHHVSIEMAARSLRYQYFEQLRTDIGATAVCVAHHQDDSVETVLMNLMRGTGIRGLCGIQPLRDHIVRPLLCLTREEIETWLSEQGQDYVTDSTNLQPDVVRNYIRLQLLPLMRQRFPAVDASIQRTASHLCEVVRVYEKAISEAMQRLTADGTLPIGDLLDEPSPEAILFEWLTPRGFAPDIIEQIANRLAALESGRSWQSDTHELTVHGGRLILQPLEAGRPTLRIPEPDTYVYSENERFRIKREEGALLLRSAETCTLDAAGIDFPLTIRPVATGDRFRPLGMKGTRLVSDMLTDLKMNLFERRRQLAVTDAKGEIVWLVGIRPSEDHRISTKTKQTLVIEHTR